MAHARPLQQRRREGLRLTARVTHRRTCSGPAGPAGSRGQPDRQAQAWVRAGLREYRYHLTCRSPWQLGADAAGPGSPGRWVGTWLRRADGAGRGLLVGTRRADAWPGPLPARNWENVAGLLEPTALGQSSQRDGSLSTDDAPGRGTISLEELAGMDVIDGPRHADPGTQRRVDEVVGRRVDCGSARPIRASVLLADYLGLGVAARVRLPRADRAEAPSSNGPVLPGQIGDLRDGQVDRQDHPATGSAALL